MPRDPTYETFQAELDTVLARHNELLTKTPGYVVTMMLHEADYRRDTQGIDLEIREAGDGIWIVDLGQTSAVLGVGDDPSRLESVDEQIAVIDHRGAA